MSKYIGLIRFVSAVLGNFHVLGHFQGPGCGIGDIGHHLCIPGRFAQWTTCLITDACLTADPGVGILILAQCRTFVEIHMYHETISAVILLLPLIIQKGLLLVTIVPTKSDSHVIFCLQLLSI